MRHQELIYAWLKHLSATLYLNKGVTSYYYIRVVLSVLLSVTVLMLNLKFRSNTHCDSITYAHAWETRKAQRILQR